MATRIIKETKVSLVCACFVFSKSLHVGTYVRPSSDHLILYPFPQFRLNHSNPLGFFLATQRLLAEPVEGVSATPYEDNLRYFNVAIAGPMDSPFEGGLFRLELFLPAEYPMKAPKVRACSQLFPPCYLFASVRLHALSILLTL